MLNKLRPQLEKGSKKLINAWAFYDWANSVYSLVISSAIFPIYYGLIFSDNNTIPFLGYDVKNTAMISFVTATAFVFVAFISPLLSGIADYIGNKKRFMKLFVYLGSVSCFGLYWFEMDTIYMGLFFYFLAMIGLWSSLVFTIPIYLTSHILINTIEPALEAFQWGMSGVFCCCYSI